MTIRASIVDVHAHPGPIHGAITIHDTDTDRHVLLHIRPRLESPYYWIGTADAQAEALPDWLEFVHEADRIVQTILTTANEVANRYAAARKALPGFPMARVDDDEFELLLWRYIRGELTIKGLLGDAEEFVSEPVPATENTDQEGEPE